MICYPMARNKGVEYTLDLKYFWSIFAGPYFGYQIKERRLAWMEKTLQVERLA